MKDRHIWVKEDLDLIKQIRDEVNASVKIDSRKAGITLGLKFLVYSCLSVGFYYLLLQVESTAGFILSFISYGLCMLLLAFNFAHDLSHSTIFKKKWLNNLTYTIIYSLVGAHAEAWKLRHVNSHHSAPNVKDYDSDLKITNLIRVIPDSPYSSFHKFQHIYAPLAYTSYSLFWVFIKDFVILYSKDEYTVNKNFKYHLSFWLQKAVYLILVLGIPFMSSHQSWWMVLVGFLAMHLSQSFFLLFTFFMTHHVVGTEYPKTDENGEIQTSWVMNQIKSSNDMHPFSKTANFILGGFNNHIAHHLFPHILSVHYPKVSRIIYKVLRENHIEPNYTTYWGGIVSHIKLLKIRGRNPVELRA